MSAGFKRSGVSARCRRGGMNAGFRRGRRSARRRARSSATWELHVEINGANDTASYDMNNLAGIGTVASIVSIAAISIWASFWAALHAISRVYFTVSIYGLDHTSQKRATTITEENIEIRLPLKHPVKHFGS